MWPTRWKIIQQGRVPAPGSMRAEVGCDESPATGSRRRLYLIPGMLVTMPGAQNWGLILALEAYPWGQDSSSRNSHRKFQYTSGRKLKGNFDNWVMVLILGLQGNPISPSYKRSVLKKKKEISPGCSLEGLMLKLKLQYFGHLMRKLTLWKRPWCWERLRAGEEGDNRGWDGWMASLTQWTWVRVDSGSWWWTGRPGVLQFMGWQRVRHDWVTELNWPEPTRMFYCIWGTGCSWEARRPHAPGSGAWQLLL